MPGIAITERLGAPGVPGVQFRVEGHIVAAPNCHEYLLPFALDGERLSLGQLEVPRSSNEGCTPRDRHIDTAFAAVLLAAGPLAPEAGAASVAKRDASMQCSMKAS